LGVSRCQVVRTSEKPRDFEFQGVHKLSVRTAQGVRGILECTDTSALWNCATCPESFRIGVNLTGSDFELSGRNPALTLQNQCILVFEKPVKLFALSDTQGVG